MQISEENWQHLLDLLDRYLELAPDAREAMLRRTDAESTALGASLRQLIRDFDAGALLSARDFLGTRPHVPRILSGGRLIGRYRLGKVIGRGAMSAVWLAEQRGYPAARPVALKFFFSSTHRVRDRERLTALQHPGIARLLDSGLSDDGQPYLVWEHAEGLPLLKFAAARNLGVAHRVALFIKVLTALSHAHAHFVLHGSLKPSNILVDTGGQVHLLDIGTSSYPLGSSDYASPEQILGEPQSATSDVYGAAAVLYELLSGQRPYRLSHQAGRARADALLAAQAPPLAVAATAAHAAGSGGNLRSLKRQLGRDLNAIVQKALHKDPAQRYAAADGFAQDLGRWLRHERISVRADTANYRVTRFLRRNPLIAGMLACMLLGLTLSLAVAVGQTRAARHQAARSAALSGFLATLFTRPTNTPTPTAADLLNGGMQRVHDELEAFPEAEIEALGTLARLYGQIDQPDGASRAEAAQLSLMQSRYGTDDVRVIDALLDYAGHLTQGAQRPRAAAPLAQAQAALDARREIDSPRRARLLLEDSRFARYTAVSDSQRLAEQAVAMLAHDDPQDQLEEALRDTAQARALLGDLAGARDVLLRAAGIAQLRHPGDDRFREATLCELAAVQAQLLEMDDAEAKFRECLVLSRRFHGEDGDLTARRAVTFGRFLQDTGRAEESRALLAPARAGNDFWRQAALVQAALESGQLDEARERLDYYLPAAQQRLPGSLLAARAALQRAAQLTVEGHFAEAAVLEAPALADARRSLGEPRDLGALHALLLTAARLDLARGEPAIALERLTEVRDPVNALAPAPHPDHLEAQLLHAQALFGMNRLEAATAEATAVLDGVRRSPLHAYLGRLEADASLALAQMQIAAERFVEAQLHAERALNLRQANQDPRSLGVAEAQLVLARSLIAQRQLPLAQRQLGDAAALVAAQPAAGAQYTAPLKAAGEDLARALHPPKPKRR